MKPKTFGTISRIKREESQDWCPGECHLHPTMWVWCIAPLSDATELEERMWYKVIAWTKKGPPKTIQESPQEGDHPLSCLILLLSSFHFFSCTLHFQSNIFSLEWASFNKDSSPFQGNKLIQFHPSVQTVKISSCGTCSHKVLANTANQRYKGSLHTTDFDALFEQLIFLLHRC